MRSEVPDLQVFKMGRFLFSFLISYAGEGRSVNNSDLFFYVKMVFFRRFDG